MPPRRNTFTARLPFSLSSKNPWAPSFALEAPGKSWCAYAIVFKIRSIRMADFHLRYIGSKKTLFPSLNKVFARHVTKDTLFGDYFAGTGTVAYLVGRQYGCPVVANDAQYYAYVINRARLTAYSASEADRIRKLLRELNALPPAAGFVARHYAPPARTFFTKANAAKIDAMRTHLEKRRPTLPDAVYFYALAKIVVAADRVANTTAVYTASLKQFKPQALRPVALSPYAPTCMRSANRVYNKDALALAKTPVKPGVVYLDPPYNRRQYSSVYHILNTIAKNDAPTLLPGAAGMPATLVKSEFSSIPRAEHALSDLIDALRDVPVIIMSYNDEGIIPVATIRTILSRHGRTVGVDKFPYKKFDSGAGGHTKPVHEYVFVSKRR